MSHERASCAVSRETLAAAGFDPADSAGLFVGVSHFADSGFPSVPYAVDDAIDLAHLFALELQLIEPTNVVLALAGEPKKPATVERLGTLLDAGAQQSEAKQTDIYSLLHDQGKASGARGLFVSSLATHGFTNQGGDALVAADTLRRCILRTGVVVNELFDDVARGSSPRRLVLLDACRERLTAETRALGEGASAMSQGFAEAIASAEGQVVLAGAMLGGYAYDDPELCNGVFSAAVIDGLRGAAGVDERGFVTVRTLADYVDARVAAWVRAKRPDHASLSRGIARRIEGAADLLPLAVDPARRAMIEAYRQRRALAVARLRDNLGSILTGSHYDQMVAHLPSDSPAPEIEELLEEIEALDGSARNQRALVHLFGELQKSSPPDGPSRSRAGRSTPAAQPPPSAASGRRHEQDGSLLVHVPGDEYVLGADDVDDASKPIHRVPLSPFWIGKHPVTNEQYRRFVEATGHREPSYWDEDRFNAPRQPVVGVSWLDAKAYVEWAGLSLPSEAQWEAAARGKDQRRYPWGPEAPTAELADFGKNYSSDRPDPVGSHPKGAGPFGAEDQAGGVWEWCEDVWDSEAYAKRDGAIDPVKSVSKKQDESSTDRVLRGGAWLDLSWHLPAAFRGWHGADFRDRSIGFRVVCGSAPEP